MNSMTQIHIEMIKFIVDTELCKQGKPIVIIAVMKETINKL